MKDTTKAYLAITAQSLIIGFSFLLVKIALRSTDIFGLLAHRFNFAFLFAILFNLRKPVQLKAAFSGWLRLLPYCLVYPLGFFLFQTLGLMRITSSETGIIYAIVPILTLIAAKLILKEQISRLKAWFMLLSVAGVIFINLMNGFNLGDYSYLGFFFVLISAISFAIYNIFAKKLVLRDSVLTIATVMSLTGFIVFNAISITQHLRAGTLSAYFTPLAEPGFIFAMLHLGVLSSLGTSLLSMYALERLEASKVSLFNNVSTVVSILAGALFLREVLYGYHYIGILAVLIGTVGFNLAKPAQAVEAGNKVCLHGDLDNHNNIM